MGPLGVQEMIAIFLVALLLFGPKKLPELGRMLGKALSEFRRAKNELKATFETHLNELERETRLSSSQSSSATPDYSSPRYPYQYDDLGHRSYDSIAAPEESASSNEAADSQPSPSTQSTLVAGTVPRSNASHAGESVPVSTEQDRIT